MNSDDTSLDERMNRLVDRLTHYVAALGAVCLIVIGWEQTARYFHLFGWHVLTGPFCVCAGFAAILAVIAENEAEKKPARSKRRIRLEHAVLRATQTQNPISVETAALATGLSLEQSAGFLRQLEARGHAIGEVTEDGTVVYRFRTGRVAARVAAPAEETRSECQN